MDNWTDADKASASAADHYCLTRRNNKQKPNHHEVASKRA